MSAQEHLVLSERTTIEQGIQNGSTKVAIAKCIGKDPTTVAKEIRTHRKESRNNTTLFYSDCIKLQECKKCTQFCSNYSPSPCKRRDRTPGVCNGCKKISHCHKLHYKYNAVTAQKEYEETLSDARHGINFTTKEFTKLAEVIVPLIKQGQSPYQIIVAHPELDISEKTLYNYVDWGYFATYGITNSSLKRKVKYHLKRDKRFKKRADYSHFMGRTYEDYLEFCEEHNLKYVPQMDTVYNDVTAGPFLQTLLFPQCDLIIAILHTKKTSEAMVEGLNQIRSMLGEEFTKLFPALLTDRGSEFSNALGLETNSTTNDKDLHLFYCDPMRSSQKAQIEKTHSDLRCIIPKNMDLAFLTQEKVNLMCSHVNSMPREVLNGKSAYEMFEFLHNKKILDNLNIQKIPNDEIILRPTLIK